MGADNRLRQTTVNRLWEQPIGCSRLQHYHINRLRYTELSTLVGPERRKGTTRITIATWAIRSNPMDYSMTLLQGNHAKISDRSLPQSRTAMALPGSCLVQ